MSIHDDEVEYQQWREEKEDWEMMQEYKQNCDRVEAVIADIADNIQAMEIREFKDCLCQVDIIGIIREKLFALQFDEDRVGLLQAEVAGLKQGHAQEIKRIEGRCNIECDRSLSLQEQLEESSKAYMTQARGLREKIGIYENERNELRVQLDNERQFFAVNQHTIESQLAEINLLRSRLEVFRLYAEKMRKLLIGYRGWIERSGLIQVNQSAEISEINKAIYPLPE